MAMHGEAAMDVMFKGRPVIDPGNYVPFYASEIMAFRMDYGAVNIAFLEDHRIKWVVINRVIRPAASLFANGQLVVRLAGGKGIEQEILLAVDTTGAVH